MGFIDKKRRAVLLLLAGLAAAVALVVGGCGGDNGANSGGSYESVVIGGQTWMKKNLNIETSSGSWCYENSADSCKKYGRLYDAGTALWACPNGWHLPTRAEWGTLAKFAGGTGTYGDGGAAGKALKSTVGWSGDGGGTDTYGFSALPGGYRDPLNGSFRNVGEFGNWWTAESIYGSVTGSYTYFRKMSYKNENVDEGFDKSYGLSVRCLRD